MYKLVSLFSGCGGLDLGFKQAGFDLSFATDHDPDAVRVYRHNVDRSAEVLDVTRPDFHEAIDQIGHADVVLGGFPCQGFSKAGPKIESDSRNNLYREMLSVVKRLKPRIFVAENVDGLRQNFGGKYLRAIVDDFSRLGYKVDYKVIDAVSFGLPQHRRRIFFIGSRIKTRYEWPAPTHHLPRRNGDSPISDAGLLKPDSVRLELQATRTVRDAIADLPAIGKYPDHQVLRTWPQKHDAIIRRIGPGQKLCNVRFASTSVYTWDIPEVFGETSDLQRSILEVIGRNRRKKIYGNIPNGNPIPAREISRLLGLKTVPTKDLRQLVKIGYLKETANSYDLKGAMFCSGIFKRLSWNQPSPTVLTNFHNPRYFLHPSENRPLSLRECARLQGFPDDFSLSENSAAEEILAGYRLIGNAVPPPLAYAIALTVRDTLEKDDNENSPR